MAFKTCMVEGTNDASCLSKFSMVKQGYFDDAYLIYFVSKQCRRSPLIHLGYYVRASVISNVLKEFFAIPSLSMCQVISFGAGFDTSFFRLSGETNKNVVYYEIDLPRVVLRKIQCIQGSDVLKTIIGDFKVAECGLSSNRYHLINADLRDLKSVETLLLGAGVNLSLPTLFLSECAITYLDEAKSDSLIQWATTFPNATFITYEQIEPGDGFGTVMLQHFESLNTPLQSVKKYPSLLDQEKRYNKLGWKKCVSIPGLDAYFQYATDSEFVRVTELEPFDEWEEFHLKCCHYSLVIASQGNLKSWSRLCKFTSYFNIVNEGLAPECKTVSWDLIDSGKVQLYGHSSVLFAGKNGEMDVLIAGGFGCDEQGTHKRNKHAFTLMTKDSLTAYTIKEKFSCDSNESMFEAMHATLTLYKPNDTVYQRMILYGGRTSPENCVNVCPALVEVGSSSCVKCDPLVADISSVVPRWRHSSVIAKQHGNDMFVVFGGRSKNNKVLHDMWKINLSTEFSKRTIVQMKIHLRPRFSHSAAVMSLDCSDSDTVLISGGLDEHLSPLDDVWEIDMKTEQYHRINIKGMLPRYGHTSHIFHSTLILVGGVNVSTGHQPGICVIDLQRKVCMEYQLPGVDPEKPVMLINHSSEVSTDKSSILVIGGGGNCFSFGTFLNSHIVKIPFSQFNIE